MSQWIRIELVEQEERYIQRLAKRHPHQFVRRKALVILLKHQKMSEQKISNTVGVCKNTIRTYCRGYNKQGCFFLEAINFYKPSSRLKLHEDTIRVFMDQSPPASIKQACAEIEMHTGVAIRETQMRHFLKTLKAGYRKVCGIPGKANIEAQQIFKEQELEPRLKEAEDGLRTVFFVDAAHFVLGAALGFLWCLTRVFLRTPSGRQRLNVLGALNAITKEVLTITNETYITSTQVCDLLRLIAENTTGAVTVVLDNAKYQRCKLVMCLAAELNIELLFLPPYSPNLNLIERLWKFIRKKRINSTYYPDFTGFKQSICTFIETMGTTCQNELQSLLTLRFQTFTAHQLKTAQ